MLKEQNTARDTLIITLFRIVLGICFPKSNLIKCHQKTIISSNFKWTYGPSGNGYRVSTTSKLYQIALEIIKHSLRSIEQLEHT